MSLLSDIQAECVAPKASVTRLLRLCLQLATRLKHVPLKEWVQHELNGYPSKQGVPDYRVFSTRLRGFFADRFVGQATLDVPASAVPKEVREDFTIARLTQPIRHFEELLERESTSDFQIPWPPELVNLVGPKVSQLECLRIWQELPRSTVAALIDTVKTRVLSMALEIESENPQAGDIQSLSAEIPEAKVAQIFNTNIYGGQVQNLAAGSNGVNQTATSQVFVGNASSLKRALLDGGISSTDADELISEVEIDRAEGQLGIGARAAKWLAKIGRKAAEEGGDIGKQTIVGLATQALIAYLGLGG